MPFDDRTSDRKGPVRDWRATGDRFRAMILSRGNTEDLAKMYEAWLGSAPNVEPMLKYRGLAKTGAK